MNNFDKGLYEDIGAIKQDLVHLKTIKPQMLQIEHRLSNIERRLAFWRGAVWAWSGLCGVLGSLAIWLIRWWQTGAP